MNWIGALKGAGKGLGKLIGWAIRNPEVAKEVIDGIKSKAKKPDDAPEK